MATADGEKKLPLLKILNVSLDYCLENFKAVAGFSAVNLLFLLVTLRLPGGYGNPLFLIWLVFYYVFWCFFFRFYFNRRPYLMFRKIFDSLVPSTKILFLTAVFGFGLSLLPLVLPFLLPPEMIDGYTNFLREYMPELDLGLMLLLLLVSPLILYRPFMAWISSVIGRSRLLKTAFAKTEGNYWRFVAMAAVFNAVFVVFEGLDEMFDLPDAALMVVYAPLLVYFNAAIARTYEFFFLDGLDD